MQERLVQAWVGKIPLKKEMTTHSSILAWKTAWTGEPVDYRPWGLRVGMMETEHTHMCAHTHDVYECVYTYIYMDQNSLILECFLGNIYPPEDLYLMVSLMNNSREPHQY